VGIGGRSLHDDQLRVGRRCACAAFKVKVCQSSFRRLLVGLETQKRLRAVGLQGKGVFQPPGIPIGAGRSAAVHREVVEPAHPVRRRRAEVRQLAGSDTKADTEGIERRVVAEPQAQIGCDRQRIDGFAVQQGIPKKPTPGESIL
jgi:hypothetical protein